MFLQKTVQTLLCGMKSASVDSIDYKHQTISQSGQQTPVGTGCPFARTIVDQQSAGSRCDVVDFESRSWEYLLLVAERGADESGFAGVGQPEKGDWYGEVHLN